MDLVFVLLTVCAGGLMLWQTQLSVTAVIAILAVTNGTAVVFFAPKLWWPKDIGSATKRSEQDLQALWKLSRWALVGAIIAWSVNNGYLYFAGGFLGVAALADLNAARLLLIPISIVAMAWGRVARPALGKTIVAKDWGGLRRLIVLSTLAMEVFALVYVAMLLWGFPWLSANLFGEKYQHISGLLLLWSIYFAVNCARNVGTTTLISFGAYRVLFWQGLSSVPVLILGCLVAIPQFGVMGALAGMILVEVCELAVNWFFLLPKAMRQELSLE
jgi:O-antigen/teichoic acid export membrane protein